MIALITESENKNKKFDAHLFQDGIKIKQLSFGDNRYEDYTQHKDKERKKLYSLRHKKENWDDPFTKGFWAKHLLWNKPTLKQSAKDIYKQFDIEVFLI